MALVYKSHVLIGVCPRLAVINRLHFYRVRHVAYGSSLPVSRSFAEVESLSKQYWPNFSADAHNGISKYKLIRCPEEPSCIHNTEPVA